MDVRQDLLTSGVVVGLVVLKKLIQRRIDRRNKTRKIRKIWQEKWLQRRDEGRGGLNMLHTELSAEHPDAYKSFIRMGSSSFNKLLALIEPDISKQHTKLREAISAENRLAVTLRYLASATTYRDLMFATRIHESTIKPEVCKAIMKLIPSEIKMPGNSAEWKEVSCRFETLWNFPMCIGALDGKHINLQAPRSCDSLYYNYKGMHSIVLLALVDANYNFLYIDVGVNGRISDGGVFQESSLWKSIHCNTLNLPEDSLLPGTEDIVPYVIVEDDAFPLSKHLMKPFPQRGLTIEKRIFYYRLSRARRVVENAFGLLSNRFRILQTTINLAPHKVEIIALTCCILHNFLARENHSYIVNDNCQSPLLRHISQQGGTRYGNEAILVRQRFCQYFSSVGAVEWQNRAAGIM